MDAYLGSSMGLCPINFNRFNELNSEIKNLEACVLLAKLKFHQINSKITKEGKIWIVRSRHEMTSWFGFTLKKLDRLLSLLEKKGVIKKKTGLWYGEKKLFITVDDAITEIPINLKIFKTLYEQTGSIKSALLFARIAYSFANTKIEYNGLKWCCIKKEDLSNWSGISIRTIDGILGNFLKSGIILKKNFIWKEKNQSHFHITQFAIEILIKRYQPPQCNSNKDYFLHKEETGKNKKEGKPKIHVKVNGQICRQQPAKKGISIIKRTKSKQASNNTHSSHLSTAISNQESDIIFDTIGEDLTTRQEIYLKAAITNTVERKNLKISSPKELWEQIKFSILTPLQRQGVKTFQHAVSRCMKILSDGNWRTPIGFNNFSSYGSELKKANDQKLEAWEKQKAEEQQISKQFFKQNALHIKNPIVANNNQIELTNEAINIAKKLKHLASNGDIVVEYGSSVYQIFEELRRQMEGLIRQGADRNQVLPILQV